MNLPNPKPLALGFLTVLEHAEHGLFGGYLILNSAGRPLEFHCTAPIKPTRAQQILYGPTLEPFLYGEQIGQTLLAQCSQGPAVVFTDRPAVLAVRPLVDLPVALVLDGGGEGPPPDAQAPRPDGWHASQMPLVFFELGINRLAVPCRSEEDQQRIAERLAGWEPFDLAEPFQRIRQAIEEAQQAVR